MLNKNLEFDLIRCVHKMQVQHKLWRVFSTKNLCRTLCKIRP